MRCFSVLKCQIQGRLDPLNYTNPALAIVGKSKWTLRPIGSVISDIKTGFAAGKQEQAEELEEGIVQLRPTNISEEGQIYFDKFLRVKSEVIKRKKIAALQRKAILFNNTNSQEWVGKRIF